MLLLNFMNLKGAENIHGRGQVRFTGKVEFKE